MPPIADFPVFPTILQYFMGGHVNMLRHTIMDFPKRFDQVGYLSQKVRMKDWFGDETSNEMEDFFSDGVHPSALTYQLIGKAIAEKLIEVTVENQLELR